MTKNALFKNSVQDAMYKHILSDLSYCRNNILDKTSKEKEILFNVFQEQMVNFYSQIFFNKTSKITEENFERKIVAPLKKFEDISKVDVSQFSDNDKEDFLDYKFKLLETYFLFMNKYELASSLNNSNDKTIFH